MVDCDKLMVLLKMYQLGPDQYGILGTDTDADIMEQENSNIKYTVIYIYIFTVYILYTYCIYAILAECSYQILVTNICTGGRISHILTNFFQNISALNNKHFVY